MVRKYSKSKYGNKKVKIHGVTYDSKKEARYLEELKLREKGGEIVDLTFKNKYEFVVNGEPVKYIGKKRSSKQLFF